MLRTFCFTLFFLSLIANIHAEDTSSNQRVLFVSVRSDDKINNPFWDIIVYIKPERLCKTPDNFLVSKKYFEHPELCTEKGDLRKTCQFLSENKQPLEFYALLDKIDMQGEGPYPGFFSTEEECLEAGYARFSSFDSKKKFSRLEKGHGSNYYVYENTIIPRLPTDPSKTFACYKIANSPEALGIEDCK